jgi:hypothetical protein
LNLLEKLSSYNLFNYLLPGIIFVILADVITSFSFIQKDIILGLFLYYFIGLVISRIGSLVIEPILRRTSFVQFSPYKDFATASKSDTKIEMLSEVNNMYRTFASLFFLLLLLMIYEKLMLHFSFLSKWSHEVLIILLLFLFLLAYRKHTSYIIKRIDCSRKEE